MFDLYYVVNDDKIVEFNLVGSVTSYTSVLNMSFYQCSPDILGKFCEKGNYGYFAILNKTTSEFRNMYLLNNRLLTFRFRISDRDLTNKGRTKDELKNTQFGCFFEVIEDWFETNNFNNTYKLIKTLLYSSKENGIVGYDFSINDLKLKEIRYYKENGSKFIYDILDTELIYSIKKTKISLGYMQNVHFISMCTYTTKDIINKLAQYIRISNNILYDCTNIIDNLGITVNKETLKIKPHIFISMNNNQLLPGEDMYYNSKLLKRVIETYSLLCVNNNDNIFYEKLNKEIAILLLIKKPYKIYLDLYFDIIDLMLKHYILSYVVSNDTTVQQYIECNVGDL